MDIKQIYIAAPFTGNADQKRNNVEAARYIGARIARRGYYPVMPTVNTYGFNELAPTVPNDWWYFATVELMRRCDAVLFVDGWEQSTGCCFEKKEAEKQGIPIFFSIESLSEYFTKTKGG